MSILWLFDSEVGDYSYLNPLLFFAKRKVKKNEKHIRNRINLKKYCKTRSHRCKSQRATPVQVQVSSRFLPTFVAFTKLGSGTATQLSHITGRARAFESKNLNEMQAIGLLGKKRSGKTQVFYPRHPNVFSPALKETENSAKGKWEDAKEMRRRRGSQRGSSVDAASGSDKRAVCRDARLGARNLLKAFATRFKIG